VRIKKRKTNSYHGHRNITAEKLEDRRLLSVAASASVLVFNSAIPGTSGAGPSHVDTLTLTNTGSSAETIPTGAVTIIADTNAASEQAVSTPGAFSITNPSSVPSSLAPGQSFTLNLQYTASQVGVMFQSAILQVQTSDSTVSVQLHGLSTSGQFGTDEPSLVQILRANDIPTIVGAGPNDSNYLNSQYPINPDPSSTEVTMPRLVKAGSGPVTITPLASFNASAQPTVRFGDYTPGDATDLTELFTIGQSDAQTVNPTAFGVTSFDPGASTFGLYATYPGTTTSSGKPDTHYSENALNTLDPSHPQKFRFFPLENADGSVVPNAYVVASEDYNGPQYNSFVNFVGIINNVKPAADATGAAVLGLTNPQGAPSTTRLVFNRIQNRDPQDPAGFTDIVHDSNSLVVTNTGDSPLDITGLTLSDTTNWQLSNPPLLPAVVQPGGSLTLSIKFIAVSDPPHTNNQTNDTTTVNGISVIAAGGVWNGALTISSNDPVNPARVVQLAGYWQNTSENENEPGLQTIVNSMFGYGTTISNSQQPDFPNNGKSPVYYGEESQSAYWNAADPTLPVSVVQLDSYHSQYDLSQNPPFATSALLGWYPQGSANNVKALFHTVTGEGQSVLPYASGGSTAVPASGSFTPSGAFGWYLDGERSDNALNTTDINTYGRSGHAVRFYPARDATGNLIPNTWLMVMDYQNTQYDNSDYQDNVYLVSNMRPTIQAPAPQTASATVGQGGVTIEWTPVSDPTLQGYNIYRSTAPNGTYALLNTSPVSGFSFADGSAPSGASSYYRITAVDASGESEGAAASILVGPPVPASVVATPQGTSAVITWAASAGAASYDVFRQLSGDSTFSQVATAITATTYTDNGLSAGGTYTYEVRAVSGSGASGFTLAAPITISAGNIPAAPTGLIATAAGSSSINLAWVDNSSDETGFLIERSTGGNSFVQIASVGATVTSYTDIGLDASTTYVYRVRAANNAGDSGYTLPASATTAATAANAPATPTNLVATPEGQNQINLTWTDNSGGAASFVLFRALGNGAFAQVATIAAGTTSYGDTGLLSGTIYVYEVQATASGVASNFSNVATATTAAAAASGGFDVNLGAGAAKTLKFRDADGTLATIVWKGPGSAILSFGGTGLSQSTVRGVTTVSSTATLDSLTATGTTAGTSITITTKGGNKVINLGAISITGALGKLTAGGANLTGSLTATGNIKQLTLATATNGSISAPSIATATFTGVFSDALDLTTLGSFRARSIAGGTWAITNKLTALTIRSTFAAANIAAGAVGTMSLGKITTNNNGQPFGITLHTAKAISGSASGKRFSLRKITTSSDIPTLLAKQNVAPGDFKIQTA